MLNKIILGDCLEVMKQIPDKSLDMALTSPPYDSLRIYGANSFWDFEATAKGLFRVLKDGGVLIWVVGDATTHGSETGTSFRQALFFKDIGFNLHDTMIYHKKNYLPRNHNRYEQAFEYIFVLSVGRPKTFNPIREPVAYPRDRMLSFREKDGHKVSRQKPKHDKIKSNIFSYKTGGGHTSSDPIAHKHPAIFPEKLAEDNILSWSCSGDVVLDPFVGSGTTAVACINTGRNFIGIEKEEKYVKIAEERVARLRTTNGTKAAPVSPAPTQTAETINGLESAAS